MSVVNRTIPSTFYVLSHSKLEFQNSSLSCSRTRFCEAPIEIMVIPAGMHNSQLDYVCGWRGWCLTRSFEKGDVRPSLLLLSDGPFWSKHNLNFAVTHLKITLSMNCVFILFILFSHSRIIYYYNHYRIYEPPKKLDHHAVSLHYCRFISDCTPALVHPIACLQERYHHAFDALNSHRRRNILRGVLF